MSVLHWNNTTQLYDTVFSTSGASGARLARGISPDGKYYIQDEYGSTTILEIYEFGSGTYTLIGSFDISTLGTFLMNTIKSVSIYQDLSSTYYAVISYVSSGAFESFYLTITASNPMLFQQATSIGYSFNGIYLTPNGSHLLGYVAPASLYYYSYDNTTTSYTLLFSLSGLPSIYVYAVYCSYGNLFGVGTGANIRSMTTVPLGYIFFTCSVSNCDQCSFIGICSRCASGFQLSNNQCVCPVNQTLNAGVCINCSVTLCDYCSSPNVCSSCSNGYVLAGSNC